MNKIHGFFNRMDKAFGRVFRILMFCFLISILTFIFIHSWSKFGIIGAILILILPSILGLLLIAWLWRQLIKRESKS